MGELCSTRTTSSATGGSTLTAPRPRVCTLSTTRLLLSARPTLELLLMLLDPTLPLMAAPSEATTLPPMWWVKPRLPTARPPGTPGTEGGPASLSITARSEGPGEREGEVEELSAILN